MDKNLNVHISFGNQPYYKSLDILEKSSLDIGKVDKFIKYTQDWLKTEPFWNKNQYILSFPKGAGYWIWKPYIILKTFESLQDGDCVLYSDAALKVIDNLKILFELSRTHTNDGKILFKIPDNHLNKHWTKRDCFILTDCDSEKYWNGLLTNGAISVWEKNDKNIEYLKIYLKYLRDPRIVTDDPNFCGKPNILGFKEHRHDQSVLSLLSIKNNITLFRDPTQFGNNEKHLFNNSPYEQLFDHHRTKL